MLENQNMRLNKCGDSRGMQNPVGSANPWWTGSTNYRSVHRWVRTHKPKTDTCEMCHKTGVKLELSSNTHEYTRNFDEYRWLCHKCHAKFDNAFVNLHQGSDCVERVAREVVLGLRTCIFCGATKPLSEFGINKYTPSKTQSYCKECGKAQCHRYYYKTHPNAKPNGPKASKYKGVHRTANKANPWRAVISWGGNSHVVNIGVFPTEELASVRYIEASEKIKRIREALTIEPNYEVGVIESKIIPGLVQE